MTLYVTFLYRFAIRIGCATVVITCVNPSTNFAKTRFVAQVSKLDLNTEKEGCMSYTTPEDAQRPRAVHDKHPDFRGI